MKQLVLILMSLLTFSCSSKAQKQTADTDRPSDKKILVAYFSCTGTTEKVATAIAKETGGKLYRITPATAYTSAENGYPFEYSCGCNSRCHHANYHGPYCRRLY